MTDTLVRVAKGTGNVLQEVFVKTILALVVIALAILFAATVVITAAVNIIN